MLLSILENALMSFILEDDMSNSAGGDVFFFWSHVSHRHGNRFVLVTM